MKNKQFTLSSLALLIQAAIYMQAQAVETTELHTGDTTVEYIGLITEDEDQKWTNSNITVKNTIQPIWLKNKPYRKLGAVTTGEGDDGNLTVNGSYGILSYAERELDYKPELYVRSNNDIIFNNNFQSVYIQPYSNIINLEAKGKIDFNLNLLEKARNNNNQEYLVNNKSLINYVNFTSDNSKGILSLTSKKGNHLNLNAKLHKDIHHSGIVNHFNTDVTLTATEGDNIISLKANLMDEIGDLSKFNSSSYLRGIETAFNSHTTLIGENNTISITTEGDGAGLGKLNPSATSPYSGHTTGIFINNQSNNLADKQIDGFSSVRLNATKGNNEVNINVKNHGSIKGIIASNSSQAHLMAEEGNNIIKVKNPDINTPLDNGPGEDHRAGIQSSTDSSITLNGKNNIIEIGGNPMYQEGLQVFSNSSISLKAKENNEITVENAAYSSEGVATLIPQINDRPSVTNNGNKIILEAAKDNIITMQVTDEDMEALEASKKLKETEAYKKKKGSKGILSSGETSLVKLTGENNYVITKLSDKARAFEHKGINSQDGAEVTLIAKENNAIAGANDGTSAYTQGVINIEGKNNTILSFQNGMIAFDKGTQTMTASEKNEIIGGESGIWTMHEGSKIALKGKNNKVSSKLALYADNKSQQTLNAEENNEISGKQFALISDKNSNQNIIANNENNILSKNNGLYANNESTISLKALNNIIDAVNTGIQSINKSNVNVDGKLKITSKVANNAINEGKIKLNYANNSEITGATIANGGNVAIKPLTTEGAMLNLTGDVLSTNNGKIELNLTDNSYLTGRLDNFTNANNVKHKDLFNRYVTNLDSNDKGMINLYLAKNAKWTLTGQSWLDKLGGMGTVDFARDNKEDEGRALHIGELVGSNKFLMHLNKNGVHSDMIYVKKGTTAPQDVVIKNLSEVLDSMDYGERLRFATIKENSGNEFIEGKKYIDDSHLMERALTVEYSDHKTDVSNTEEYNLKFNGEVFNKEKSGNEDIETVYGGDTRKNVYLVKNKTKPDCGCDTPSKNVKDIHGMFDSTAHYALTLDTYTKREGEREYSGTERKNGWWSRAIHTKLTQDNTFSIKNNDYEIGYDEFSINNIDKKRKWGVSFNYGHANTSLVNQYSQGKINKYEFSLYNTTQYLNQDGEDKDYIDNVVRVGTLRNHTSIIKNDGNLWGKGKYSNNLFTIGSEYGYRKYLDDDKTWRITPQAQLQYTYLSGSHYSLTNDVTVDLKHTHSLIGRAGFDVMKKFDEGKQRVYIKGNILHEFLGKHSFNAYDEHNTYASQWGTKATWYSAGIGYNAIFNKNTHVFVDAEREFASGKTESYNIRFVVSYQFK